MQANVEMDKLVRTARIVASLAPVIWGDHCSLGRDCLLTFIPESSREQLSTATQLLPELSCAGGGSGAVGGNPKLT